MVSASLVHINDPSPDYEILKMQQKKFKREYWKMFTDLWYPNVKHFRMICEDYSQSFLQLTKWFGDTSFCDRSQEQNFILLEPLCFN